MSNLLYTDKDIRKALRKAQRLGARPVTVTKYTDLRDQIDHAPSAIRIIQRYGTWKAACVDAGVTPGEAKRTYTQKWTRKQVLGWVALYLKVAKRPSYADFSRWLQKQKGAPSAQSARNIAGSWSEMKAGAAKRKAAA